MPNLTNPSQKVKEWFSKQPWQSPKFLFLRLGIGILVVVLLIASVSYLSKLSTPLVQGKVLTQEGKPIDGAVVSSPKGTAVTLPDGSFSLQAASSDNLKISAFGFESTTVTADQPTVTLTSLPPGTVRVLVVGPDNKELEKALVLRLNANTAASVGDASTDKFGSATFLNVPSGQAMFIVAHPDYGVGWVQTALSPSGYAQPIVRLDEIKGERKAASNLIPPVYAQEFDSKSSEPVSFQINSITEVSDGTYQIVGESRTVMAISFERRALKDYIDRLSKVSALQQFSLNNEVQRAVNDLVARETLASLIKTVRITQSSADTTHQIEYGLITDAVVKTVKKTYQVEIEKPTSADVMAYLQQQYALNGEGRTATVTSWSQLEAKDLAGVKNVSFNPLHGSVCCNRPDAQGTGQAGNLSSETSSSETPPSPLRLSDFGDKASFIYSSETRSYYNPDLSNVQKLKEQNPGLNFTDKNGSFSLLDIEPPNPLDAPAEFLYEYFDHVSDARSLYAKDPSAYQKVWADYLFVTGSTLFQNERLSARDFRDILNTYINGSKAGRAAALQAAQSSSQSTTPSGTGGTEQPSPNSLQPTITEEPSTGDEDQTTTPEPTAPTAKPTTKSGGGSSSGCGGGGGAVCPR